MCISVRLQVIIKNKHVDQTAYGTPSMRHHEQYYGTQWALSNHALFYLINICLKKSLAVISFQLIAQYNYIIIEIAAL